MRLRRSAFEHPCLCCKVWPRGRLPVVCWPRRLVTDAAQLVVLTFVLFAGAKLDCSLPLPQCRAPPQIAVI